METGDDDDDDDDDVSLLLARQAFMNCDAGPVAMTLAPNNASGVSSTKTTRRGDDADGEIAPDASHKYIADRVGPAFTAPAPPIADEEEEEEDDDG